MKEDRVWREMDANVDVAILIGDAEMEVQKIKQMKGPNFNYKIILLGKRKNAISGRDSTNKKEVVPIYETASFFIRI